MVTSTPIFTCSLYLLRIVDLYRMDPRHTDTSNTNISTPNWGGALQLTGGTSDFPNSTQILYHQNQKCRMILVPLLLGISDTATAEIF